MARPNPAIAAAIAENLKGEGDARAIQQRLLALPGLDSADIYTIMEISADESNHALLYEAMFKKYSGITASPDGAAGNRRNRERNKPQQLIKRSRLRLIIIFRLKTE